RGLAINPDDARIYAGLGKAHFRKTQYEEALNFLNKGLKINAKESELYVWFGYIYQAMGKLDEAEKYLLKGKEINPADSEIYRELGKIYRDMGKYEESVRYFKKVIDMKVGGGYEGLARTYEAMGKKQELLKLFNKEIKKGYYYYACPYQGLGNVYKKMGNPTQAEDNLLRVVKIEPYRWQGYYDLAEYYCEVGKMDKAAENIEKALTFAAYTGNRNKAEVIQLKGFILIMQGKYDLAQEIFNNIIHEYGVSCSALAGLGHVYNARKEFFRAREYFTEGLKLSGERKDKYRIFALLGLGWVNANEHNDKEAVRYYSQVLEEQPLNILALLGMGNTHNWLGEYDLAQRYFNKVLEIDKNNEYALAELATVYLNQGNKARAQELLTESLKINNTTYSCPYEGLGVLYLKEGKVKEAEDNFKKAIEINPDIEYRKYNGLAQIYIKQ
ncbi:MAG: tetratricopeptide repeat protein, partial [Candidatus Subteraquimicrobiales bacterium]|nr:tetratricopeptide repeat protein [Candidatus Subteraquimicrobiales bacterium]